MRVSSRTDFDSVKEARLWPIRPAGCHQLSHGSLQLARPQCVPARLLVRQQHHRRRRPATPHHPTTCHSTSRNNE